MDFQLIEDPKDIILQDSQYTIGENKKIKLDYQYKIYPKN